MFKKIIASGTPARVINVTDTPQRKIASADLAKALGAEPVGEEHDSKLDPISLAHIGSELLGKRAGSSD